MISLDLIKDETRFTASHSISGKSYIFFFDWNERDGAWYLSLFEPGTKRSIAAYVKLVQGVPLFKKYFAYGAPPFPIYAVKQSDPTSDIGYQDMNSALEIICFEEKDLTG